MPLSYSNGDVNSLIAKNGTDDVSNGTNGEKKSADSDTSRSRTTSNSNSDSFPYEFIEEIASFLLERTTIRPKIGIICGTGLGHLADNLTDVNSFPYEEIPNFPVSTVSGHAGKLVFGRLGGVEVMCMQGRFHYYEGYPLAKCAMPVRVMKLVGVTQLIATNAAGGLNSDYNVGDIMIVKDHINIMGFAGNSPLQGPNDLRFGPRFPPMGKAYDPELISIAQDLSRKMGLETHAGVYICVGGPNYETVAELRMWKILGVDALGMSTVHEVITARHCDMKVFAFSLITNKCETDYEAEGDANHDDVVTIGLRRQGLVTRFVTEMVTAMNEKAME